MIKLAFMNYFELHVFSKVGSGFKNFKEEKTNLKNEVIDYMEKGVYALSRQGFMYDVLSETTEIAGSGSLMTDGEWVWPDTATYYIEKYDLKIPEDFLQSLIEKKFMFNENFEIPKIDSTGNLIKSKRKNK